MAKAAQRVIEIVGAQITESRWGGAGTFKDLLLSARGALGVEIATAPNMPGYLYDRGRHRRPAPPAGQDRFESFPPELAGLARSLNRVISLPGMTPREYALVFTLIAEVVREQPYNLTATSRAVRDLSIERGELVSRANVSFILNGITVYAGHRFGVRPERDTPLALAEIFEQNVVNLCRGAQLELSDEDKALLHRWLAGELAPLAAERGASEPPSWREAPANSAC
jgi:hypothetical protein